MQGINTHIPETNHVPKEYNVAAILSLLFMVPISLAPALALMYFYISTFRSMCAVSNMAVFCSSLTSWFPGMVLTYFLNDFEMTLVAPIITVITLVIIIIMQHNNKLKNKRPEPNNTNHMHHNEWSALRSTNYDFINLPKCQFCAASVLPVDTCSSGSYSISNYPDSSVGTQS
jgi:hypothetical protein